MHGGGGHGGGHGGHGGHGGDIGGGHGNSSGQELPSYGKLKQCDAQAILSVSRLSPNLWLGFPFLFGIMPILMGLGFLMGQAEDPQNDPIVVRLLGAAFCFFFGLVFSCAGIFALAPTTLRIDVLNRTYQQKKGWGRLCKEITGTWEEFSQLTLQPYNYRGRTNLLLNWRNAGRPPGILHTSNAEEAQRQGLAVATFLSLPLRDENGMPIVRLDTEADS